MLDEVTIKKMTQDGINEIAGKYCEAKKNGDKNDEKSYLTDLCKITISDSELNRKLQAKIKINSRYQMMKNDVDYIISGYAMYQIRYYTAESNDNFVSFMLNFFNQYLFRYIQDELKNRGGDTSSIDENPIDYAGDEDYAQKEDRTLLLRSRVPTLITNFYGNLSKKQANKARYNYFRIFNTEFIAQLIIESGNTIYFNKTEAYESTDKNFVKFIAYSDYEKLDDLLDLRFRKYSDIFDDYPDEEKAIEELPCEDKIVAEYLYKSELDNKRPTVANVSDMHQKYKDYRKAFLMVL